MRLAPDALLLKQSNQAFVEIHSRSFNFRERLPYFQSPAPAEMPNSPHQNNDHEKRAYENQTYCDRLDHERQGVARLLDPVYRATAKIEQFFPQRRGQRTLLLLVIANHILKPNQLERLRVFAQLASQAAALARRTPRRWCRIEGDPRISLRKIDFHPRVRIALAHGVRAGRLVVLAGQKSIDDTRGNPLRSQHHGHRGGKVFAVSRANIEKKIS